MTAKPVFRRRSDRRDADDAVIYYARQAGMDVAGRFIVALENAYRAIGAQPGIGSPLHGHRLNIDGLRSRPVRRFPYLIFYKELDNRVEVWRVLHAQRDIPATLDDSEG